MLFSSGSDVDTSLHAPFQPWLSRVELNGRHTLKFKPNHRWRRRFTPKKSFPNFEQAADEEEIMGEVIEEDSGRFIKS